MTPESEELPDSEKDAEKVVEDLTKESPTKELGESGVVEDEAEDKTEDEVEDGIDVVEAARHSYLKPITIGVSVLIGISIIVRLIIGGYSSDSIFSSILHSKWGWTIGSLILLIILGIVWRWRRIPENGNDKNQAKTRERIDNAPKDESKKPKSDKKKRGFLVSLFDIVCGVIFLTIIAYIILAIIGVGASIYGSMRKNHETPFKVSDVAWTLTTYRIGKDGQKIQLRDPEFVSMRRWNPLAGIEFAIKKQRGPDIFDRVYILKNTGDNLVTGESWVYDKTNKLAGQEVSIDLSSPTTGNLNTFSPYLGWDGKIKLINPVQEEREFHIRLTWTYPYEKTSYWYNVMFGLNMAEGESPLAKLIRAVLDWREPPPHSLIKPLESEERVGIVSESDELTVSVSTTISTNLSGIAITNKVPVLPK